MQGSDRPQVLQPAGVAHEDSSSLGLGLCVMPLRSQSQCVAHLGLDPEGPDCKPKVTEIQNSDFNSPK